MRCGDFAAAWAAADVLLRRGHALQDPAQPRHLQRVWDGRPLVGRRVLVRCHHGLGDTVQFARLMPRLRAIAHETLLWAQPALLPILATIEDVGPLAPLTEGAPPAGWEESQIELMELPHALRLDPSDLPGPVPYLHVAASTAHRRRPNGTRRIGLVWAAGDWDARRSLPAEMLAPLAALPRVELHLLQRGSASRAWCGAPAIDSGSDDVGATAATMRALDLVISVDSFPAHLAGALGVEVWTLLHADPDWRWMTGRAESPWYPTMRLFRQEWPGDWRGVIDAVVAALRVKQW